MKMLELRPFSVAVFVVQTPSHSLNEALFPESDAIAFALAHTPSVSSSSSWNFTVCQ